MNQAPHSKAKLAYHKGEKSIAMVYIAKEQVMEQPCMHTIAKIKNSMWQACTSYQGHLEATLQALSITKQVFYSLVTYKHISQFRTIDK